MYEHGPLGETIDVRPFVLQRINTFHTVEKRNGRHGTLPAFKGSLNNAQIGRGTNLFRVKCGKSHSNDSSSDTDGRLFFSYAVEKKRLWQNSILSINFRRSRIKAQENNLHAHTGKPVFFRHASFSLSLFLSLPLLSQWKSTHIKNCRLKEQITRFFFHPSTDDSEKR